MKQKFPSRVPSMGGYDPLSGGANRIEWAANSLVSIAGVVKPPVPLGPLHRIPLGKPLRIAERPLGIIRALSFDEGREYVVVVDTALSRVQRRYVAVRESLYILRLAFPGSFSLSDEQMEVAAEEWAAHYLMPSEMLKGHLNAGLGVRGLAALFDVPFSAMYRRIERLHAAHGVTMDNVLKTGAGLSVLGTLRDYHKSQRQSLSS